MTSLKTWLPFVVLSVGCASSAPQVRRLGPLYESSAPPAQCKLVSVLPGSPADKAGLQVGDVIVKVQGQSAKDATEFPDLINKAPAVAQFEVSRLGGASHKTSVRLNDAKPRLGAICDLTGWKKSGITAAGNESLTLFDGPYNVTGSGIIDKGVVFMRIRISNNSDKPLKVDASVFKSYDGNRNALTVLSPREVMCYLYGDRGAQLLAAKRKNQSTLDADTAPRETSTVDDTCSGGTVTGRISGADMQYVQANAEYVAAESLWPTTLPPGGMADGLVYMTEPGVLPVTFKATLEGREFAIALGTPQASAVKMKISDLSGFFEQQKKGAPIRVTTKKGRVFVGKFTNYDAIDEKVWIDTSPGSIGRSVGIPLTSLRSAEPIEPLPARPAPVAEQSN